MFNWFKKKSVDTEAHKKIESLNNSVSNSFKNLKRDMNSIDSWINNFTNSHDDHSSRLGQIEKQLSLIIKKLEHHENMISSHSASFEAIKFPDYEYEEELEEIPEKLPNIPNNIEKVDLSHMIAGLTDTQKLMFIRLLSLQRERGGWVPLKSLAEELYPDKEYNDVRSTISEYLTLLSDWGVVTKKRTGKQSFVMVTEKGEDIVNYIKSESKTLENKNSRGAEKQSFSSKQKASIKKRG